MTQVPQEVTFTVQAAKPDELSTVSPGRGVALAILFRCHQFLEFGDFSHRSKCQTLVIQERSYIYFFCYKRLFLTKGHAAVLKKTQKK